MAGRARGDDPTAAHPTVGRMGTDDALNTLYRRLGARPRPAAQRGGDGAGPGDGNGDGAGEDPDTGDTAFAPSWVPDGRTSRGQSWLAAVRADPGRAGGITLALIALLAVLVTVFTLARQRPAPVVAADLPPVEMVSTAAPRSSSPAAPDERAMVVSVVGLLQLVVNDLEEASWPDSMSPGQRPRASGRGTQRKQMGPRAVSTP